MVRLEVIEMQEPGCEALDALKAYAAVSDNGQDYLLKMALRRAFGMVQQAANRALLPVVLKYATAVYDGKESRELSQILRECL